MGEWIFIVVSSLLILVSVFVAGMVAGSSTARYELQEEAIKKGFGTRVVDSDYNRITKFVWIETKKENRND